MGLKYKALISYSHADEAWASWLHSALERYRIPKRLRAQRPELPERLYPVFRDRSDLASSTNLSEAVQRALAESEALIVICSPAAAASRWVNEEIRRFKALGRTQRIFCLLIAGSPERNASDCAFPQALLIEENGELAPEPLAADVARDGGKRTAFLKIAAGLLDIGVDDLKHRDAQRRARLWSAVAAGSLGLTAATAALAVFAVLARNEADLRREQAENLIGFMLGDLRERLQPIGKLNVLDAVGDQAMRYFEVLGDRGTDAEVLARAKALRQIGEVRFHQGRLEPALESFNESHRILDALYAGDPQNNEYLFELSQSEFWIGYVAWERKDLNEAQRRMERYMECSRALTQREPENEAYEFELSQAYSNLGSIARQRGDAEDALRQYQAAVASKRELIAANPDDTETIAALADDYSWIGRTRLELGELQASEQAFSESVALLAELHERDIDAQHSQFYSQALLWLAEVQLHRGESDRAEHVLGTARGVLGRLNERDPANGYWKYLVHQSGNLYASLLLARPDTHAQLPDLLEKSVQGFEGLSAADPTNTDYWEGLGLARSLWAELSLFRDDPEGALSSARRASEHMSRAAIASRDALTATRVAMISEALGFALHRANDQKAAQRVWSEALSQLERAPRTGDLQRLAVRRQLAFNLGRYGEAELLGQQLSAAAFADPRFQRIAASRDRSLAPIRSARR